MNNNSGSFNKGIFFALISYIMWGLFPLYWKMLIVIDSLHILAFRILLSLVVVGIALLVSKNSAWLAAFKDPKKAFILLLAALFLCGNWGLYIWAVNSGHTIEASLGYFINPLVSIVLGLLFFRERLTPLQWTAVGIAIAGVLLLTVLSGTFPWISLILAFTFGFYGLIKKKLSLSALESLGAETLVSAPFGILMLFFTIKNFNNEFETVNAIVFSGLQGLHYLSVLPVQTWLLLTLCGFVSTIPLYFFARSVKILPLSALGFTQFICPTLQFLLGLLVFGEEFPFRYFTAFGFIWTAVILYIVSLRIKEKRKNK